ncbi:hypothetical protein FQN54_007601 [Arachnomyces sp. PD_36]|nr:hypothetical protein FQN54_007601 [Arachnomyces sp. PD_36]
MASTQLHSQGSEQYIAELCRILRNDFTSDLTSAASRVPPGSNLRLRVEGRFCNAVDTPQSEDFNDDESRFLMGYIDFGELPLSSLRPPYPTPEAQPSIIDQQASSQHPATLPLSPVSGEAEDDGSPINKRRKFVGGLRLKRDERPAVEQAAASQGGSTSCRQAHIDTRFPQRNTTKDPAVPTLEPSSADKLVAGIWRQIHSNIELVPTDSTRSVSAADSSFPIADLRVTLNKEAFHAINSLCLRYYNLSRSTRALEMIVQAYWVECYEARILAVKQDNPAKSSTEANMEALKEACSVFGWSEKELRNKLFEVAADTLHPEWRQLLEVIGQRSVPLYHGHPHSWVISSNKLPLQLCSTYTHTEEEFNFQFIEESVLDRRIWDSDDPRRESSIDLKLCLECGLYQSEDIKSNKCRCFSSLYGNPRSPVPIQICNLPNGKNNGVIACVDFARGTAIGEFVGFITKNLDGVDVMIGGSPENQYQIFQGQMGNFTRFINHSCRPNAQFQRFYWLGTERIIVVSRGIQSGNEITVDYSNHYWEKLDKICLCGEPSCRYANRAIATSEE